MATPQPGHNHTSRLDASCATQLHPSTSGALVHDTDNALLMAIVKVVQLIIARH